MGACCNREKTPGIESSLYATIENLYPVPVIIEFTNIAGERIATRPSPRAGCVTLPIYSGPTVHYKYSVGEATFSGTGCFMGGKSYAIGPQTSGIVPVPVHS